jgi:hypothetical protein
MNSFICSEWLEMVWVSVALAEPFSWSEANPSQEILNGHPLLPFRLNLSQKDDALSRRNGQTFRRHSENRTRHLTDR